MRMSMRMLKTLALCLVGLSAMAQDGKPVAETPAPRLILHVDMKAGMMRRNKDAFPQAEAFIFLRYTLK